MVCFLCCLHPAVKGAYFWLLRTAARPLSYALALGGTLFICFLAAIYFGLSAPLACDTATGTAETTSGAALRLIAYMAALAVGAHLLLACLALWQNTFGSDPGYVARRDASSGADEAALFCERCALYKREASGTRHCRVVDRCVEQFDHYCPWLGTAVGARNHGRFLLLLFYVTLGAGWAAAVSHQAIRAVGWRWQRGLPALDWSLFWWLRQSRLLASVAFLAFLGMFATWLYMAALDVTPIAIGQLLAARRFRDLLPTRAGWRNVAKRCGRPSITLGDVVLWWSWLRYDN